MPALPFLDRGDKPLTARALGGDGAVEPSTVFDLAKAHDATMVDLKFTDLPGTWQHMGMSLNTLEADSFSDGIGFDGSSIRGFQEIYESDMLLMPEALGVANPLLRNATRTDTSTLRVAPEFRARARAVLVPAARGLGAAPSAAAAQCRRTVGVAQPPRRRPSGGRAQAAGLRSPHRLRRTTRR